MRRAPSESSDAIVLVQSRKIQVGFFLSESFSSIQSGARVQSTTVERLYGSIDCCGVGLYRRVAFFAVPHGAGRLAR
jgi:hypothetical protein